MAKKEVKAVSAPKVLTAEQKLYAYGIELICLKTAEITPQRKIAAEIGVSWVTLMRWIDADTARSEQYARAREAQADKMAEEILDLADQCRIGQKTTIKANGDEEVVTADMVERSRLQIDARKWLAGKMAPKKYGDRQQLDHSGQVGVALFDGDQAKRMAQMLTDGAV